MPALEGLSAQNVVTGKTQGSRVREPNKCKVADEASGHVPVSFAPPVASNVKVISELGRHEVDSTPSSFD